jgi:Delta3,5-Delta2,4-dienoyl-CoA isomerase
MSYPNKFVSATFPSEGVLLLNINRPPLNCLNTALWLEIGQACTVAGRDPDVRCIVLASEVEKLFTAGLDLK